ncbi:MAG: hypothetical protein Q8R11_02345 [bacterium]|nr:hypothetical protein [bacterium]
MILLSAFFFLEFLLLFFLSRRLTSRLLSMLGIRWYGLVFLPGILVHELAHFLVATLLFVRTGKIEIFPQTSVEGRVQLGSIGIAHTDPIRRFFIGIAPVLVGTSLMLWALFSLMPDSIDIGRFALLFFIVFELGNTMFSSKKDMEGAFELFIIAAIVLGALFLFGVRLPAGMVDGFFSGEVELVLRRAGVFLLLPLALDGILLMLTGSFGRHTSSG